MGFDINASTAGVHGGNHQFGRMKYLHKTLKNHLRNFFVKMIFPFGKIPNTIIQMPNQAHNEK